MQQLICDSSSQFFVRGNIYEIQMKISNIILNFTYLLPTL